MPARKTRTRTCTNRTNRASNRVNKKSPARLPEKRAKPPSEENDGRTAKRAKDSHDRYCWKCHRSCEGVDANKCFACPRVYHRWCLTRVNQFGEDRKCSVCAEQEKSKQEAMPLFRSGKLSELLWAVVKNAFDYEKQGVDKLRAWDPSSDDDKLACVVDYRYIRDRVRVAELKYRSPAELLDDVKWMYHNCVIVDGENSATTKAAKEILGKFNMELDFLNDCPKCYERKIYDPDFFSKPCEAHHLLVWAKMKFHPYWPAKLYKIVNKKAHVRFFETQELGKIPLNDCYFMSSEYPKKNMAKKSEDFNLAMKQKDKYLRLFKDKYGTYPYQTKPLITRTISNQAPNIVPYNEEKAKEIITTLKGPQNLEIVSVERDIKPFARNRSGNAIAATDNNPVTTSNPNDMSESEPDAPNNEQGSLPIITSVHYTDGTPLCIEEAANEPQDDAISHSSQLPLEEDDSDVEIIEINPSPNAPRNTPSYQEEVTIMQNYIREDKKLAHLAFNASCYLVVPLFNQIVPIMKQVGQQQLRSMRKSIRSLEQQIRAAEEADSRNTNTIVNADSVVGGTMALKENYEQQTSSVESLRDNLAEQRMKLDKLLEAHKAKTANRKNTLTCTFCGKDMASYCCYNGSQVIGFCNEECRAEMRHYCNRKEGPSSEVGPSSSEGRNAVFTSVTTKTVTVEVQQLQVNSSEANGRVSTAFTGSPSHP